MVSIVYGHDWKSPDKYRHMETTGTCDLFFYIICCMITIFFYNFQAWTYTKCWSLQRDFSSRYFVIHIQKCRWYLNFLQIVEDRIVSFLLSPFSSFSIHKKLLISEQFNLPFLKVRFKILNSSSSQWLPFKWPISEGIVAKCIAEYSSQSIHKVRSYRFEQFGWIRSAFARITPSLVK